MRRYALWKPLLLISGIVGLIRTVKYWVTITKAPVSVIDFSQAAYSILKLTPGVRGQCWFHGQAPHHQDREVFKRLGGEVVSSGCRSAKVLGARFTSEANICPCVAPPVSAFGKHFLEIGSADGQYLSNLLFFEMQLDWRGICIEGSPTSFALLKINRPKCSVINAVIGPDHEERTFYTFDSPGSWEIGMSCMQGTACGKTDSDAQQYADANGLTLHKTRVPMSQLSTVFAQARMKSFGWIMVDVEGAEDLVIPTIDFSHTRAQFVSYEGDHAEARKHLLDGGYNPTFKVGPDQFFELIA